MALTHVLWLTYGFEAAIWLTGCVSIRNHSVIEHVVGFKHVLDVSIERIHQNSFSNLKIIKYT